MSRPRRWVPAAAGAAALVLLGGGLIYGGLRDSEAQPAPANTVAPRPEAVSPAPASPGPDVADQTPEAEETAAPEAEESTAPEGPAPLRESAPTRIDIPAIDVDSSAFVELGLNERNEVESPERGDDIGWFTRAHSPGSPGVGVIAAHVTWNGAEAPFFELGALEQGDEITVDREDGSSATFAVTRLATFAKDDFPTEEVYRYSDEPELVLVTCGGEFDADARYYDSNVIVWAEIVDTRPA